MSDTLERSLDLAITAVRVAGQRELVEVSPGLSEVLDWCWAFEEIGAALSFVSGRLCVRIDRLASRQQDGGFSIEGSVQLRGMQSSLEALEGCFESAAAEARTLFTWLDQLVKDTTAYSDSSTN